MNKKIGILAIIAMTLTLILFLPIPQGTYDDGGTRDYNALTYKIVRWNKIITEVDENGQAVHNTYRKISVFWYPDSKKSIDELWQIEKANNNCIKVWSMGADYKANAEQSDAYRNLWNSLAWKENAVPSKYNYIFIDGPVTIYYDSLDGILYDMTNNTHVNLSKDVNDELRNSIKDLTFMKSNGDVID